MLLINDKFCLFSLGLQVSSQSFGFIDVQNEGAYVARFFVTYSVNGVDVSRSSGDILIQHSKVILTPVGAQNLRVTIQYMTFPGVYVNLMDHKLLSSSKCYILTGSVFAPRFNQVTC